RRVRRRSGIPSHVVRQHRSVRRGLFCYLEDADLAWRAQLAGWRAVYAPMARVTHWHSATSVEGSPFKSHLLGRNKVWLIAKNYPIPQLWYYLPLIVAYDVAAIIYSVFKHRDL